MLNQNDLAQIASKGISAETVETQMNRFSTGFPFLRLAGSATVGHGITRLTPSQEEAAIARWEKYLADGGGVTKKRHFGKPLETMGRKVLEAAASKGNRASPSALCPSDCD